MRKGICARCGKIFPQIGSRGKYCSKECKDEAMTITKICRVCGNLFQTKSVQRQCCSKECSKKMVWKTRLENEQEDGYYRPKKCRKPCYYNQENGCMYRLHEKLEEPIRNASSCMHFLEVTSRSRKPDAPIYFDSLYGHIASHLDSHSAMWMT